MRANDELIYWGMWRLMFLLKVFGDIHELLTEMVDNVKVLLLKVSISGYGGAIDCQMQPKNCSTNLE